MSTERNKLRPGVSANVLDARPHWIDPAPQTPPNPEIEKKDALFRLGATPTILSWFAQYGTSGDFAIDAVMHGFFGGRVMTDEKRAEIEQRIAEFRALPTR
jgi:hypothetical protein